MRLRISIPFLKADANGLGAACVTSLGTLGFEDAVAPQTPFANWTVLLASNAITKQPVVEDDKIVVGNVMNCNFVVDHRYIDGAHCTKLIKVFKAVFEEPERFMDEGMKTIQKDC